MSIEAGVVVDTRGEPLHWHLPTNRTVASLPDNRDLWYVFWENRANLSGFAHSHPGRGTPGPSWTDLTTFAAVEDGIGQRLDWWITSEDSLVVCRWVGPGRHAYKVEPLAQEPAWVNELRRLSEG